MKNTVENTIALKLRARKIFGTDSNNELTPYMGFDQEIIPTKEDKIYSPKNQTLPNKYIDVFQLPTEILKRIKSYGSFQYANGKLLAYVGNYGYPTKEGYKHEEISQKNMAYFMACNCDISDLPLIDRVKIMVNSGLANTDRNLYQMLCRHIPVDEIFDHGPRQSVELTIPYDELIQTVERL
jgi:hypothetical protein